MRDAFNRLINPHFRGLPFDRHEPVWRMNAAPLSIRFNGFLTAWIAWHGILANGLAGPPIPLAKA